MTRDQIIERVAWYCGCGDTPKPNRFDRDQATVIVDMLGAKELKWDDDGSQHFWIAGEYTIALRELGYELTLPEQLLPDMVFDTLEAAKAAAQAHHEAEHWKRTKIWEMTDAPERIWAVAKGLIAGSWSTDGTGDTEYIRADLHEALQAENARLREDLEKISNLMPDDYSPHSVEGMTGRIARAALTDPAAPLPNQGSATETDER